MAIRHREVFPVGSAPDSISWEQWNDDHVGVAGAITQDQQDALDAANAPAAGNPFATIADVGAGALMLYQTREVLYSEFVTDGGSGADIDPFITIPTDTIFGQPGIIMVELFNDSFNSPEGVIDISEKLSSLAIAARDPGAFLPVSYSRGNLTPLTQEADLPFSSDGVAVLSVFSYAKSAAQIYLHMPQWAGDGTTGKFRVVLPMLLNALADMPEFP